MSRPRCSRKLSRNRFVRRNGDTTTVKTWILGYSHNFMLGGFSWRLSDRPARFGAIVAWFPLSGSRCARAATRRHRPEVASHATRFSSLPCSLRCLFPTERINRSIFPSSRGQTKNRTLPGPTVRTALRQQRCRPRAMRDGTSSGETAVSSSVLVNNNKQRAIDANAKRPQTLRGSVLFINPLETPNQSIFGLNS